MRRGQRRRTLEMALLRVGLGPVLLAPKRRFIVNTVLLMELYGQCRIGIINRERFR